jgi:hypothetical protein
MKRFRKEVALALLAPALAACGDATGSSSLTPADVAGLYEICTMRFIPDNPTQPDVDIRATVFETTKPGVRSPQLALDVDRRAGILFTLKDRNVPDELTGSFNLTGDRVVVSLPASEDPSSFLLPGSLSLDFQTTVPELTSDANVYSVDRDDYARLSGVSEAGLAAQIPGHLSVRAQTLQCN